ncbi:MAG: type I secretion system permease/ATPase, partial [Hyphomicrobiaceae bacterium]|nr:type I secretion system permease/ATPase [Hyphomicrobiaceae bacterium]
GELWTAIAAGRDALKATAIFSFVINLLMLTGPLFMLQVYDRVMTSGSIPTLVALSVLTAALYAVIGTLEMIRSRIVVRVGLEFDRRVADRVFTSSLRRSVSGQATATSALRELDHIRQFIGGPGPLSLFDAPWTPVYLLVVFMMHWVLGLAATVGALILLVLAWLSERMTRAPLVEAARVSGQSFEMAETGARNAEAITAMGMLGAYRERWQKTNAEAMAWQVLAADRLGTLQAVTKTTRLGLQSLMLAIGAALAISGNISAGTIVAATIIFGRALAPVEQAIGHWRGMLRALDAYGKIDTLLRASPEQPARTALPDPKGHLRVANLRVAAPDSRQLILSGLNFEVPPGQMLAVIGPSASGKSTLARTLVGLWPPLAGAVQLDGARLDQWDHEALGRHIGYLPQSVELFSGTVKDNIARFRVNATDADIVAAAQQAHAHDLILSLPNGYETQLGSFGTYLSAGQRQRIALARALFGNPRLVVLDEPNANLDRVGDDALDNAVDGMRARGQAVVLVSHRVQAIGKADLLLYVDRGVQRAFGPRDEVMRMFQGATSPSRPPTAANPVTAAPPPRANQAPATTASGASSPPAEQPL